MSAEPDFPPYTSPGEYLALETESPFRHEYMDGVMYAMAGASEEHHAIELNLITTLRNRLRGHRCRSSTPNMKLKVTASTTGEMEFVYPDSMICCDPTDRGIADGHAFRERPVVIFEILSPRTRRKDEFGKRTAYLAIPTLTEYIRIEQARPEVAIDRRVGDVWQEERVQGLEGRIALSEIGIELQLAELYEGLEFPA